MNTVIAKQNGRTHEVDTPPISGNQESGSLTALILGVLPKIPMLGQEGAARLLSQRLQHFLAKGEQEKKLDSIHEAKSVFDEAYKQVEEGTPRVGFCPSPWKAFDSLTSNQLRLGHLMYIVGTTGHGKSTLACQLASHWALLAHTGDIDAKWVLYITVEMVPTTVARRMAAAAARVSLYRIEQGQANEEERARFKLAVDMLRETPLYFVGGSVSVSDIEAVADKLTDKHGGPGIIFVDTLNKISDAFSGDSEYYGLSKASVTLDLLKQKGHLVVGLIQHRLPSGSGLTLSPSMFKPQPHTVYGSRHPVSDADIMVAIYNPSVVKAHYVGFQDNTCPDGALMIYVLKLRNGDASHPPIYLKWVPGFPGIYEEVPNVGSTGPVRQGDGNGPVPKPNPYQGPYRADGAGDKKAYPFRGPGIRNSGPADGDYRGPPQRRA